ncbi:hypothetical protein LTR36_008269 [Oleoguttula mirabilis]|uniref:Uncharacterized protein n=1 Tax=Oleoguttula mirabilis TaxID=1507867 RepID=A0AAV9J926_9PEZI|nr:hypothetical protein LTR36_008269 [Oleoguttula mirabilis]
MKITSVASALLLAGVAIAAPSKLQQMRHERHQKRVAEGRRSLRPLAVNATSIEDVVVANNPKEVTYSSNWAGAVIVGTSITEVTGTFTVPTVTIPSGGNSKTEYGAAAWVGIDGDTCGTAILQTGVDFLIEGTETEYAAWYEWYPDYSYDFADFTVSPGNVIKATVIATSKTAGTATIENVSTGKSITHTFSNEASLGSLCETNAEWIVEDFESGSSLVPFADFGTITFTGASYVTGGTTKGVTGASIFDVEQSSTVVTSCGVSGTSEVYCTYE